MKWIEVIQLRTVNSNQEALEERLKKLTAEINGKKADASSGCTIVNRSIRTSALYCFMIRRKRNPAEANWACALPAR